MFMPTMKASSRFFSFVLQNHLITLKTLPFTPNSKYEKQIREKIDKKLLNIKLFLAELESYIKFKFDLLNCYEKIIMNYKNYGYICDYAIFIIERRFSVHQVHDFEISIHEYLGFVK